MNSSLASFIFSGETLFHLKEEGISVVKEALFEEEKPKIEEERPKKTTFSKETVILSTSISQEEKDLLEKIMLAVNISLNDVEIINDTDFHKFDFLDLGLCKQIISFGNFSNLEILKNTAPKYQVFQARTHKSLTVDPLSIVSSNQNNEKRLLWTSLKSLYGV